MDLRYLFTSLDGRISRSSFWIGMVILTVANVALISATVLIFGISQLSVMLTVLVAILLAYPMVKRFQDHDKPGWIAFFPLPVIYGTNMLDTTGVLESRPGRRALHHPRGRPRRKLVDPDRARHPQGHTRPEPLRA
jgi:uncharacterized membrane protein YhaH (DUF805 family)